MHASLQYTLTMQTGGVAGVFAFRKAHNYVSFQRTFGGALTVLAVLTTGCVHTG